MSHAIALAYISESREVFFLAKGRAKAPYALRTSFAAQEFDFHLHLNAGAAFSF